MNGQKQRVKKKCKRRRGGVSARSFSVRFVTERPGFVNLDNLVTY